MLDFFANLKLNRNDKNSIYKGKDILFYSFLSILSGYVSTREMEDFIQANLEKLNEKYGTKWKKSPKHTTIFYAFSQLEEESFGKQLNEYLKNKTQTQSGNHIAIDGQYLHGKQDLAINMYNVDLKKQIALNFEKKGKESIFVKSVLDKLNLPDEVWISMDAIHTSQKNFILPRKRDTINHKYKKESKTFTC